MAPVWTDSPPLREVPPDYTKNYVEAREYYGFDKITEPLQVERNMDMACRILFFFFFYFDLLDVLFGFFVKRQMVLLICYIHGNLMSAFNEEMKRSNRERSAFNDSYDKLGQNLEKTIGQDSLSKYRSERPTSRTLLELLTRIIARSKSPPSLKEYETELQNTCTASELLKDRRELDRHVGIPKLIFLCIHPTGGSDQDDADPQHVIATTKENWPLLPKEASRAYKLRRERLQDVSGIKRRTEKVWETVRRKWANPDKRPDKHAAKEPDKHDGFKQVVKIPWRKPKQSPEEKMIQARREAVATLQKVTPDHEKSSHRDNDAGAAFYFPECRIAGRCFKCQSLYPFTMHPEAKSKEPAGLDAPLNVDRDGKLQCEGFPAGSCAEDLAYQYCVAANKRYRSRPAATATKE